MSVPPPLADTIGALLAPLLATLDRVEWVQRHLHPPRAAHLAESLAPGRDEIARALEAPEGLAWPAELHFMRDRLLEGARQTLNLVTAFVEAAHSPHEPFGLYGALRPFARIQEALYPLAPLLESVSRWFLEPARRESTVIARLRAAPARADAAQVGVLHASNERDTRGGFSLYVPEQWDGRAPMPLVVALHGGHGHGRDFLWSWLREARSRDVLLLGPTSRERTWSIMGGPDVDAGALREMVASVAARYPVDRGRVLLTGMSDGATYALLCGLGEHMPFTHLAAACGVLHPLLFGTGGIDRARGRPIYLVHGALDWMFPPHTARMAREVLLAAGARLVYREIEDLSHTYPRDENPRILDWLMTG
ncbi:MAG: alpha/beta hydrolase [Candidatus Rokuibacteriota bacterium]